MIDRARADGNRTAVVEGSIGVAAEGLGQLLDPVRHERSSDADARCIRISVCSNGDRTAVRQVRSGVSDRARRHKQNARLRSCPANCRLQDSSLYASERAGRSKAGRRAGRRSEGDRNGRLRAGRRRTRDNVDRASVVDVRAAGLANRELIDATRNGRARSSWTGRRNRMRIGCNVDSAGEGAGDNCRRAGAGRRSCRGVVHERNARNSARREGRLSETRTHKRIGEGTARRGCICRPMNIDRAAIGDRCARVPGASGARKLNDAIAH